MFLPAAHYVPCRSCVCVCVSTTRLEMFLSCVRACVLPWNAALVEELASAGEELLERELKGDCLKHSSKNGLKHRDKMHLTNVYSLV